MDDTDRALLAAAVSLSVAVVAGLLTAFNGKRLAKLTSSLNAKLKEQELHLSSALKAQELHLSSALKEQELRVADELEQRRSAQDAKQAYEYDARQKLYQQCQPLIFQANEMAYSSRHRVASLARSARGEQIPRWLMSHGYYFHSTAYFLLAPVTTVKILQRRLTAVDLSLEPALQLQYELFKQIFLTFTREFDLAALEPELGYDPDKADPEESDRDRLLGEQPGVYQRQGFYLGTIELVAEAMIKDSSGESRCASFGEFMADWEDPGSRLARVKLDVDDIFRGFHPQGRPVLWRLLIAQRMLADLVLRAQQMVPGDEKLSPLLPDIGSEDFKELDWRCERDRATIGDHVVAEPIHAAHAYLVNVLRGVDERLAGQGSS